MKTKRLETFNEGEFVRDVAKRGGCALKQNAMFNAGVPDRLCWLPTPKGIVWFWAEWKRKGEPLRLVQTTYIEKLETAGHVVFVFDDNTIARTVMDLL